MWRKKRKTPYSEIECLLALLSFASVVPIQDYTLQSPYLVDWVFVYVCMFVCSCLPVCFLCVCVCASASSACWSVTLGTTLRVTVCAECYPRRDTGGHGPRTVTPNAEPRAPSRTSSSLPALLPLTSYSCPYTTMITGRHFCCPPD